MECELAFPQLTQAEIEGITPCGTLRPVSAGEVLFHSGDRDFSLFVVCTGSIEILDDSSSPPRHVIYHGPGEFTGDIDMLTGRPSIVTAVVHEAGEVLEIPAAAIRQVLNELPDLSDKLLNAFQLRRKLMVSSGFEGLRLFGHDNCKESLQLREFFHKNHVHHTFYDVDEPAGQAGLAKLEPASLRLPVIACGSEVISRPELSRVAECLGISRKIPDTLFDVVIVGAGPSGLAAAVYAGSEGLKTLVVDRIGPGGQAGQSSKIENYMGFPAGLSGAELARRGYLQALKFGVEFTAPITVQNLRREENEWRLELCTGQSARTRTVIVTTGVAYRRLPLENGDRFEGSGIYYSATSVESRGCRNATAIVVGGGNSAGQAAMFLSQQAGQVKILIRGTDLAKSMSDYLVRRIAKTPNIELLTETEVTGLHGDWRLRQVTLTDHASGRDSVVDCASLFIFIGAQPHTAWLPEACAVDDHGFLLTGNAVSQRPDWTGSRLPCELETSLPGVFAAGDVRSGTTKRCAFAVGDGALAITCVHQYLSRL